MLEESAHDDVERLDAHTQRFAPRGEVHRAYVTLVVESAQPVDALHGTGGGEFVKQVCKYCRIASVVEHQDFDAQILQALRQRFCHSTFVGHDHDAAARAQRDSRWLADIERRTQVGQRHATRNAIGCIEGG